MKKIGRSYYGYPRIVLSAAALRHVGAGGAPETTVANGIGTSPVIPPIDPLPTTR